jgi:hypothetical protein
MIDDGAQKCNSTDPQTIERGTWSFEDNETKLKILSDPVEVYDNGIETYDIDELNATTLKLSIIDFYGRVTLTYTAQ